MEQESTTFWEDRYAERDQVWSGEPNRALVDVVSGLQPGFALDLGCGEGADSVWLAARGWQVTAVDIATTAVARGQALAATRGVMGRIAWVVSDLRDWHSERQYDLVSACFLHSPIDFPRADVLRSAAATLSPGGHLLIVGHAEPPPWASEHADHAHRFFGPAEELAELQLPEASWQTLISDVRPRDASGPDGEKATLLDSVVLLRRH